MTDKPATTYIVSVFDKPHWRTILSTKDRAEANTLEQAMAQDGSRHGKSQITPKAKKC